MTRRLKPIDARGRRIRTGDLVRVVAMPCLETLSAQAQAETEPVFRHLLGQCKRIQEFNRYGFAELVFRIRSGRLAGYHTVAIEPQLLLLQGVGTAAQLVIPPDLRKRRSRATSSAR